MIVAFIKHAQSWGDLNFQCETNSVSILLTVIRAKWALNVKKKWFLEMRRPVLSSAVLMTRIPFVHQLFPIPPGILFHLEFGAFKIQQFSPWTWGYHRPFLFLFGWEKALVGVSGYKWMRRKFLCAVHGIAIFRLSCPQWPQKILFEKHSAAKVGAMQMKNIDHLREFWVPAGFVFCENINQRVNVRTSAKFGDLRPHKSRMLSRSEMRVGRIYYQPATDKVILIPKSNYESRATRRGSKTKR